MSSLHEVSARIRKVNRICDALDGLAQTALDAPADPTQVARFVRTMDADKWEALCRLAMVRTGSDTTREWVARRYDDRATRAARDPFDRFDHYLGGVR